MHFNTTHRFCNGQVSIRRRWHRRMWIDLGKTLALVASSKVVDKVLVVIRFHLIQAC
jgi:hypothetical protein